MNDIERKQISYGYLVSRSDFEKSPFITPETRNHLKIGEYYLFVFIPSNDILKCTIFPCEDKAIRKILIRLKEFFPGLVKGITNALKNLGLDKATIHISGLCFPGILNEKNKSNSNSEEVMPPSVCYYEIYAYTDKIGSTFEEIKDTFLELPKVEGIIFQDIPIQKIS